jgi:hypothetical protein
VQGVALDPEHCLHKRPPTLHTVAGDAETSAERSEDCRVPPSLEQARPA